MNTSPNSHHARDDTSRFYRDALQLLTRSGIPYMVGGAFALQPYTGLARDTKDFDVFVRPRDVDAILEVLADAGYTTEIPFPHWLAKAHCGDHFIDVIYSSGNGIATVDDEWFSHAPEGEIMGFQVKLCPPEETIWSKAFIMERERYDGADVAHLLRASAEVIDWRRLLRRFGGHYRVLFSHLVLFGYIYPNEAPSIPQWVIDLLVRRMCNERHRAGDPPVCRGTFLSRAQYIPDVTEWGYIDARMQPNGTMEPDDIEIWTDAAREQLQDEIPQVVPPDDALVVSEPA